MKLLQDTISYLLALLAKIVTPPLQRRLTKLCFQLVPDIPQLGTTWVVHFKEPTASGRIRAVKIDATLYQFGRVVWGNGHLQGEPGDPFQYRGTIKRNVLYGRFYRTDQHILAGTGTFILKIAANTKRMKGHCSWFDNHLDDVWASEYIWRRKGC